MRIELLCPKECTRGRLGGMYYFKIAWELSEKILISEKPNASPLSLSWIRDCQ